MTMKGVCHFRVIGKLSPHYVGPFKVLEQIRPLVYCLTLPPQLAHVHDVFHVSMLHKCVADPRQVIDYQPLEVRENASYIKMPSCIMDQKDKVLRNHSIPYVKVQWQQHGLEEATWELEEEIRRLHPQFFE